MADRAVRLGDVIDDYCPRCRLLLNHDVASLFEGQVAKVTCRTCYTTHDYRHGEVPRRKTKQDEKKKLIDEVLASMPAPPAPSPLPVPSPELPVRKRRDLWAEVERLKGKK